MSNDGQDVLARGIPVSVPPRRVVSLVPSLTETLFDLALGHTLVGRTDYCIYPQDKVMSVPSVGGTKNPDIARILALNPDLVMANKEENRKEDVEALRTAGVTVWLTFPKTVQDALNLMWDIMNAFENTLMVPRVRLIEYTYDRLNTMAETREVTQALPVFVPIWLDPLMTINADTYVHDVLRVCGGTNVFADRERLYPLSADLGQTSPYPAGDSRLLGRDTRYPRVTWEEVIARDPHVILLPSEPFAFDESHVPIFQGLNVKASRDGRIHLVDGSYLTWHGTRVAYAMNELPNVLRMGTE
jgi:ABC-type Fe3+-hydroxamate transport system substrate-binding protein